MKYYEPELYAMQEVNELLNISEKISGSPDEMDSLQLVYSLANDLIKMLDRPPVDLKDYIHARRMIQYKMATDPKNVNTNLAALIMCSILKLEIYIEENVSTKKKTKKKKKSKKL